jgi:hemolysin activation/secretion protein
MKNKKSYIIAFLLLFSSGLAFAATVPAKEMAGGVEARRAVQENDLNLRQSIQKDRAPAGLDKVREEEIAKLPDTQKVLVKNIEVSGVKLLEMKEIDAIIRPFEQHTLAMKDMQEVANRITDAYRQKGFITSRAVLPPQKLDDGVLRINVVEGFLGNISVSGNKYFSSRLFVRRIGLRSGDAFNYAKLQTNLSTINQYPDRNVKTVLTPGKAPGTTDLVLNVKDNLPIHAGLSWDNYGSKYLKRQRYQGTLTHNNLTGHDDIMTLTYQTAAGRETFRLNSLRYLFPLTNATQIGFSAGTTQLRLGKEFYDLNARGKSKIYSLFMTNSLIKNDTYELSLESGFDYKDVFNFEFEEETSRDRLRILKTGLKLDISDSFNGRTIINNEISQGFPSRWGALEKHDPRASRAGSGGTFTKNVLDILRLQRLPHSVMLLLKAQQQFASRTLASAEEFQIGGISNVRGYPSGEAVGDTGVSFTSELSFPVYFIPKGVKVPWSKARVYDSLRLSAFYDWAEATLRQVPAGEAKSRNLSSIGCGLRFDLPENFSARLDVAWPLDDFPADGKRMHTWLKVSKEF